MNATHKAYMMRRYARAESRPQFQMPSAIGLDYDPLSPGALQ
jgi:hypothetical protein